MQTLLHISSTLVFAGLFTLTSLGQSVPPGVVCPGSLVLVSAEIVTDGDKVTFHSNLFGGNIDRSVLEYNWAVDRGKIIGGQGTPVIIVDTTGAGVAGSITATIDISPYSYCEWVMSETVLVRRPGPQTKADIFWEWFQLNARSIEYYDSAGEAGILDQLRFELSKVAPDLTFEISRRSETDHKRRFILGYGGKHSDEKTLEALVAQAPDVYNFEILTEKPKAESPR